MNDRNIEETIIYEDSEILVCHKPAGFAVQSARCGSMDMESALKNYLAAGCPGKIPYLGVVHRLDQPVEGLIVFAKTPGAAKSLSRQISSGQVSKQYLAVVSGKPVQREGALEDYLKKDGKTNTSQVTQKNIPGAKRARLSYRILQEISDERLESGQRSLVRICLETGRHHQIRVQMAHAGMPLVGDRKYNGEESVKLPLGLCSFMLVFQHPKTGKEMKFDVFPDGQAFEGFDISQMAGVRNGSKRK